MRTLVGIMYSGENEYESCIASIKSQTLADDIDFFVIENQPNKIAHDLLYETFNQQAQNYDYLLKMDADMVFIGDNAVAQMLLEFQQNPSLDHLMVDVYDCLSDIPIPGQNMYSNRVRWLGNEDRLIVDYHGQYSGESKRIVDKPQSYHMPDPSEEQAFTFGFHRALKVLQTNQPNRSLGRALIHWTIINKVYDAYLRDPDRRRLFALAGAWHALTHSDIPDDIEYKSEVVQQYFTVWEKSINTNVDQVLAPWKQPLPLLAQILSLYN